jgi:hypothetical protein
MGHVFSVIGLNHGHINGQVKGLLDTGQWSLKHVFAVEEDLRQEAYVEHRKTIDIGDLEGGRGGKLIVTRMDTPPEVIDLSGLAPTFFDDLTADVEEGSEKAIPFDMAYKASKAILELQLNAVRLAPLEG